MRENRSLALIILAIFIITLFRCLFQPYFQLSKRTFLELFILFGSLLFIFSAVVVIFAAIGFSLHFLSILAVFFWQLLWVCTVVEGAFLVTGMTYLIWGSIFAMEVLLFYNGLKSAQEWFAERYTFKSFKNEYYAFYPMLMVAYFFLELVPSIFYRESFLKFEPSKVLEVMEEVLP